MKALSIFCAVIVLAGCEPEQHDRYKIVTQGPLTFKVDTKTGQSWRWVPTSIDGGGKWEPVQNAP
jgi:hypothetical protein